MASTDTGTHLYLETKKSLEALARKRRCSLTDACKEAEAAYVSHEGQQGLRRFLFRYGLLGSARQTGANEEMLAKLVTDAAEGTSATQPEILSSLMVFSGAARGSGALSICGDRPQCSFCRLRRGCRHCERSPTLKELPETERPRERLILDGEDSLTEAELLGIIIQGGTTNRTAVDLAKVLLARHGGLRALSVLTIEELCEVKGIGRAKAAKIKAALGLGRRRAEEPALDRGEPVHSSECFFRRYHTQLRDSVRENFKVVLLDRKNRVIRDESISVGSLSASIVHPREVLNPAIRHSAAAIICVHNHPSGDPKPSSEDLEITRRLHEACKILGISLLDHIIIGDDRYFSFADEGLIRN